VLGVVPSRVIGDSRAVRWHTRRAGPQSLVEVAEVCSGGVIVKRGQPWAAAPITESTSKDDRPFFFWGFFGFWPPQLPDPPASGPPQSRAWTLVLPVPK